MNRMRRVLVFQRVVCMLCVRICKCSCCIDVHVCGCAKRTEAGQEGPDVDFHRRRRPGAGEEEGGGAPSRITPSHTWVPQR